MGPAPLLDPGDGPEVQVLSAPCAQKPGELAQLQGQGIGEQRRSALTFSGSPASSSATGAAPGRTLGAPPAVPHSCNAADPR